MAEDMTSSKAAVNECETSALLLLQSIADEWRTNRASFDSPGLLMRKCLLRAGVSLGGQEALQIHTALFRDVFFQNDGVLPGAAVGYGFCVDDYFELLRDEKLGWLPFLSKILPCLRLKKANSFLEKLTQFLQTTEERLQNVEDIRLLLLAVSLVCGIITDFLVAECRAIDNKGDVKENATNSLSLNKSFTSYGHLSTDVLTLAAHLTSCVESLLQLCRSDKLLALIHHDVHLFRQLVESLTLSIAILNPYSSVEETTRLLLNCYIGEILTLNTLERKSQHTKSKLNAKRNNLWRSRCKNFVWTKVLLGETGDTIKHLEHETSLKSNVEVDDIPNSNIKSLIFYNLMNSIISLTPITLFIDLVCWFCQGEVKYNKEFYKPLANVLFEGKDIHAGHHVLSGQTLYPWLLDFLRNATTGSLVLNKTMKNSSEFHLVFTEHMQSYKDFDFSCLNKTEIDYILESKRELAGQEDLDLVKRATINQNSGWQDLLELGLSNRDIKGWWRAGFLELVRTKEAILSTERNVRHMLIIMSEIAVECQNIEDAEFRDSVKQLFGVMFKRLPALLQEQVVLSTFVPPHYEGQNLDLGTTGLQCFLSKGEVKEQLTALLNRLTSADVVKMMGDILLLCLFDTNVVLQQIIQVALENKAQVLPVVQVLHQMSRICCSPEPRSSQSKLLFCLHEILSGITISGNKADNVVQILCLFTETYILEIDIDHTTRVTKEMPGLLSQSQIFHHFICPSVSSETFGVIARQKKEGTDKCPRVQPWEGHSQVNQEPASERLDEESTEIDEIAKGIPEIHCSHAEGDIECEAVSELSLDVALRTLSALLDKVDKLDILALKPVPLLASLADLYANNYIVFNDGELNKKRLLIKQASQKNIVLLTAAVWKHFGIFTKADFLWLRLHALKCGWLCTAVLKPVLNIGCDVELHDILNSFARQLMLKENRENNIKGLVMLMQLSLVNDEMLSDLLSVIKQSQLSTGQNQLVLAVGYILTLSLTTEMYRLVKIIIMLLANQNQPFPIDSSLLVSEVATDVHLHVQASQVLTDAALQLSTSEMTEASWCHIASNYQAAIQSLLQQDTPKFCFLVNLLCHCCTVLSAIDGQAAQLLQVSAMDILTKLKACLSSSTKGKSVMSRTEEGRLEYEKGVSIVEDYIDCVLEDSVKQTLYSQLANA